MATAEDNRVLKKPTLPLPLCGGSNNSNTVPLQYVLIHTAELLL
jgi:hypothetical protein